MLFIEYYRMRDNIAEFININSKNIFIQQDFNQDSIEMNPKQVIGLKIQHDIISNIIYTKLLELINRYSQTHKII